MVRIVVATEESTLSLRDHTARDVHSGGQRGEYIKRLKHTK